MNASVSSPVFALYICLNISKLINGNLCLTEDHLHSDLAVTAVIFVPENSIITKQS